MNSTQLRLTESLGAHVHTLNEAEGYVTEKQLSRPVLQKKVHNIQLCQRCLN